MLILCIRKTVIKKGWATALRIGYYKTNTWQRTVLITKSIYEQFGGAYHEDERGYLLPDLAMPEEEIVPVGLWGQRHKRFLKEHRPTFYNELLLEGKLNRYLADINEQAQICYDPLVEQMKERKGVTKQLKAESPWEWIGLMNNIAACAREIVNAEIILA